MCISVDLPEPDGPMTAVSLPRATSRLTPRNASTARVALAVAPGDVAGRDDRLAVAVEDVFVGQSFGWIHLNLGFAVADVRPRLSKQTPRSASAARTILLSSSRRIRSRPHGRCDRRTGRLPSAHESSSGRSSAPFAQRYWFDALILTASRHQHRRGRRGPGRARRAERAPLGGHCRLIRILPAAALQAPLPVPAPVVAACSGRGEHVPGRTARPLRPDVFLLGMTARLPLRWPAGASGRRSPASRSSSAWTRSSVRNEPTGSWSDMIWSPVIFGIAWTIGFGLGYKFREAEEAEGAGCATRARAARGGPGRRCRRAGADRPGAP